MEKKPCAWSSLFRNQRQHKISTSTLAAVMKPTDALDHLDELLYLLILHSTNLVLEEKLPSSSVLHLCMGKTSGLTSIATPR